MNGIDLVRELLNEFPDAPSRQLMRVARQRWPSVFVTDDAARSVIRRARGAHGQQNRSRCNVTHTRSKADAKACQKWGSLLPEPEPNAWRWHDLPDGPQRWLVLADLHIPFHDKDAIALALDYGQRQGCDGILLLGDIADCYRLSPFMTDPRTRRFPEEVNAVAQLFDGIEQFKAKAIVYKAGNHEFRSERYLQSRAAELFGLQSFTFQAFLELDRRGITWVPAMDPIRVGRLTLLHGSEWPAGTSTPVNPARTAFLKSTGCVVVAHQHRTSEHTEQTLEGQTITCWSVGCLCDLHPAYRPVANRWNHGFGVLDVGESWTFRNYRIVQGEVV